MTPFLYVASAFIIVLAIALIISRYQTGAVIAQSFIVLSIIILILSANERYQNNIKSYFAKLIDIAKQNQI